MKEISGDISKDYRLPFFKKIWYLTFNFTRGFFGLFAFVPRGKWQVDIDFLNRDESGLSPGRILIDNFLLFELLKLLNKRRISVLDIGCGSGYVRKLLIEARFSGQYHGVDVSDYFAEDDSISFTSKFTKSKIEDFKTDEKYDLVISNTSFEHIENDILASKKAQEFVTRGGVEVHIMPAYWSLFCYLLHGYRQYTPKRLKKLFGDRKDWRVYSLGGLFSFVLYFFLLTLPERFTNNVRFRKKTWYPKLRNCAIRLDKFVPMLPLFYVVVIKH